MGVRSLNGGPWHWRDGIVQYWAVVRGSIQKVFTDKPKIYPNRANLSQFIRVARCVFHNLHMPHCEFTKCGRFLKGTGPSASAPGNCSVEQKLSLPGSPGAVLRSSGRQHGTGESCRGKSAAKDIYNIYIYIIYIIFIIYNIYNIYITYNIYIYIIYI